MRFRRLTPIFLLAAIAAVQFAGGRSSERFTDYWHHTKNYVSSKISPHNQTQQVSGDGMSASAGGASPEVPSDCLADLPNEHAPSFDNPAVKVHLTLLCSKALLIGYFGPTRTGLWSATYLTPERIDQTRTMKRVNSFHADNRVADGPSLADYVHSGYDRGHISPSGDQPTAETQNDSFTLANMAPQNPGLNRGPWEKLEEAVRTRAKIGPIYVITGVRFLGKDIGFLHGRVGIPSTYYKMIYDPNSHEGVVYEAPNVEGGVPQPYSLFSWEQQAGEHFGLGPVAALNLTIHNGSRY
jgi:endonuclease G